MCMCLNNVLKCCLVWADLMLCSTKWILALRVSLGSFAKGIGLCLFEKMPELEHGLPVNREPWVLGCLAPCLLHPRSEAAPSQKEEAGTPWPK